MRYSKYILLGCGLMASVVWLWRVSWASAQGKLSAAYPSLSNIATLSMGSEGGCAVTREGGVKCWGANWAGQLGNGKFEFLETPYPVNVFGLSSGVTIIAAGFKHNCALLATGGVKCWGYNPWGQLGDGTATDQSRPVAVVDLSSGAVTLSSNGILDVGYHTCAVLASGLIKCWGSNNSGQLGDGTRTIRNTPIVVSGTLTGAVAVATGGLHTCAIVENGGAQCWGNNTYGQLGDGTLTRRLTPVVVNNLPASVQLAAGDYHTCALATDERLWCWGDNRQGQLGQGAVISSQTPLEVTPFISEVVSLVAGAKHTCVLRRAGTVWCWGDNQAGQLGDGTHMGRAFPLAVSGLAGSAVAIAASLHNTCAVLANGEAQCWGANDTDQLGDGTVLQRAQPMLVSTVAPTFTTVAAGYNHTCALATLGLVWCWGDNSSGQLGLGSTLPPTLPVPINGLTNVTTLVSGGASNGTGHTCALLASAQVQCWGNNTYGQLGDGTQQTRPAPVTVSDLVGVAQIAVGDNHTCAVTAAGEPWCWGANTAGQLGDGTLLTRTTPITVSGLSSGVIALAAGYTHSCALLVEGAVKCWGGNTYGQVGNGTFRRQPVPTEVVSLTMNVVSLVAGGSWYGGGHTCGVLADSHVQCWGSNTYGQLGDNTFISRSVPVTVVNLSAVQAVVAGDLHTCALTQAGAVKCWGANFWGQLGDGSFANRRAPVTVLGLESGVTALVAGNFHTCAVLLTQRVKCWGLDRMGNLGLGSRTQASTPINIIEGVLPQLTLNYPNGQPGSYFTLTGENFPANVSVTVDFSGITPRWKSVAAPLVTVSPTGGFITFLSTEGITQPGNYTVTVALGGAPLAVTQFALEDGAPLRTIEGGGAMLVVPPAPSPPLLVYLPLLMR